MKELTDLLVRAADSTASILLLGETEPARALRRAGCMSEAASLTTICDRELPESLRRASAERTFRPRARAFTGAVRDHWGKVKQAEGGTLFLDEIGDLAPEVQAKLLRLLQEGEYERIGETTTRKANVRVIAATNRDLKQEVQQGAFREDLYYRLAVISVEMPPLRQRPADVLRLADHYLESFFPNENKHRKNSRRKRGPRSAPTAGPETCVNCEMWSNAQSFFRATKPSPAGPSAELGNNGSSPVPAAMVGSMVSLEDLNVSIFAWSSNAPGT